MPLPAPYSGSTINVSNSRAFIPKQWADMVLMRRDPGLVMKSACYPWPAKGKGDILYIPEFGDLGVYQRQRETSVHVQTQEPTQYEIKCDLEAESSIAIDDMVQYFANYNIRNMYANRQAYALRRDLDNRVLGMRAGLPLSQHIFNTTNGTASGTPLPLSPAAILAAKEKLILANVPEDSIKLYIGVYQHTDLLAHAQIIDRDYYPGYTIQNGQFGEIYGVRAIKSNNIVPNSLAGYRNGDKGQLLPTPGVIGSPYLPTQGKEFNYLPIGQTGNEAAEPFITALMCHEQWCLDATPKGRAGVKITESFENALQMHLIVAKQCYGHKIWRDDHAVLIHSAAKR